MTCSSKRRSSALCRCATGCRTPGRAVRAADRCGGTAPAPPAGRAARARRCRSRSRWRGGSGSGFSSPCSRPPSITASAGRGWRRRRRRYSMRWLALSAQGRRSATVRLLWPGSAQRHVHAGAEAAKRVDVGCRDRHRRRHQRQHACHRLLHVVAQFARRAGQQVLAVLVLQTDVEVQPAAGGVGAGLGHKAGVLVMLLGNLPRQAL